MIKQADWPSVRSKGWRIYHSGGIHPEIMTPEKFVGKTDGDHGTYHVTIDASMAGEPKAWTCTCLWGYWCKVMTTWKLKGRACSHMYAASIYFGKNKPATFDDSVGKNLDEEPNPNILQSPDGGPKEPVAPSIKGAPTVIPGPNTTLPIPSTPVLANLRIGQTSEVNFDTFLDMLEYGTLMVYDIREMGIKYLSLLSNDESIDDNTQHRFALAVDNAYKCASWLQNNLYALQDNKEISEDNGKRLADTISKMFKSIDRASRLINGTYGISDQIHYTMESIDPQTSQQPEWFSLESQPRDEELRSAIRTAQSEIGKMMRNPYGQNDPMYWPTERFLATMRYYETDEKDAGQEGFLSSLLYANVPVVDQYQEISEAMGNIDSAWREFATHLQELFVDQDSQIAAIQQIQRIYQMTKKHYRGMQNLIGQRLESARDNFGWGPKKFEKFVGTGKESDDYQVKDYQFPGDDTYTGDFKWGAFTDPFPGGKEGKMMTPAELIRAIRLDIAAEEDATALYEAHAEATDDPKIKEQLLSIAKEERVHVGEFLKLIDMLTNGRELKSIEKGYKEAKAHLRVAKFKTPSGPDEAEEGKCWYVLWAEDMACQAYRHKKDALAFATHCDKDDDLCSISYKDVPKGVSVQESYKKPK